MNRVVYILGAGFSAPLGLPLMSNFLLKSKDLYFSDPDKYEHFVEVFDAIDKMSTLKNYFEADLFNIEEILSIIEMGSFVTGTEFSKTFSRYICDTIVAFTPEMTPYGHLPGNWQEWVFGNTDWRPYGYFVKELCNMSFRREAIRGVGDPVIFTQQPATTTEYSVITLNYDRVLETVVDFIAKEHNTDSEIGFQRPGSKGAVKPLLAKLHGTIEAGEIVPPTWSKGSHKHIVPEWEAALRCLEAANYIRILGYSLPENDAYIRYLLKAASAKSRHLKRIDVINPPGDTAARSRYEAFVRFNYFKYAHGTTEDYLGLIAGHVPNRPGTLESLHEEFVRKNQAR